MRTANSTPIGTEGVSMPLARAKPDGFNGGELFASPIAKYRRNAQGMPDLPPASHPYCLLPAVSRWCSPTHLRRMSVVSCDSLSGLRIPEEPLSKCVPTYLLTLLAGCCAAGVPDEV